VTSFHLFVRRHTPPLPSVISFKYGTTPLRFIATDKHYFLLQSGGADKPSSTQTATIRSKPPLHVATYTDPTTKHAASTQQISKNKKGKRGGGGKRKIKEKGNQYEGGKRARKKMNR